MFSGVYLGEPEELTQTTRRFIPIKDVYKVQALCNELDDEPRWLVALISDTGMRLSEAAGLIVEDIKLDCPHPHILLRPHPWRRLKTQSSERIVPLVGAYGPLREPQKLHPISFYSRDIVMSFGARVTLQVQHLINGSPLECLPVVSCIPLGIAIEIG